MSEDLPEAILVENAASRTRPEILRWSVRSAATGAVVSAAIAATFGSLHRGGEGLLMGALAGLLGGAVGGAIGGVFCASCGAVLGRALGWPLAGTTGASLGLVAYAAFRLRREDLVPVAIVGAIFGAIIGAVAGSVCGISQLNLELGRGIRPRYKVVKIIVLVAVLLLGLTGGLLFMAIGSRYGR